MKSEYDFSRSRKNPYIKRLKRQITIRLDAGSVDYFKQMVLEEVVAGGIGVAEDRQARVADERLDGVGRLVVGVEVGAEDPRVDRRQVLGRIDRDGGRGGFQIARHP